MKARWADPEYRERMTAHNARISRGGAKRRRVPDGMRREQAKWFWRQAKFEATLTMKKLEKAGLLEGDDEHAKEALHTALTIMRAPVIQKDQLAAARLVLEYTKAKPAQKQEITVNKAEEWLAAVVEDAKETQQGATGGA
jgi:hypothetical protein